MMSVKQTYEELEQRVKELEKRSDIKAQFGDRLQIFQLAIDQSSEGYAVSDMDGNLEYLNDAFAQIHGYSAEELIGKNLLIFHAPEQIPSVEEANREIKQTGSFKGEIWHTRRDGTVFPTMMHNSVIKDDTGKPVGMMGRLRDISDIRQAEEALRESEEKYRSLTDDVLDGSAVGIFILDSDFRVVWVNQALEDYFGLQRNEVIGKDKRQLIRERIKGIFEDPDSFTDKVFTAYDDNTYIERFECHVLPNGKPEERWLEHRSQPIQTGLYAGGRIEHYYDITDMKQGQEALRKSEAKFRRISENTPAVVYQFKMTPDGAFTFPYVNDAVKSIMGVAAEDVKRDSSNLLGVIHPEDQKMFLEGVMKSAETLETYHEIFRCLKDGKVIWVECRTQPNPMRDGSTLWDGFFVDITERKHAEEALRESEERYRNLFNNAQVGIFRTRISDGKVLECNDRFAQTYGYKTPEDCKDDFVVSEHYADPDIREKMVASLMEKGEVNDIEGCFSRKDGDDVWVRFSARAYPEEGYLEGVGYDITEEKRALEALRESEEHLRSLMESASNFAVYRLISDVDNPNSLSVIFVSPSITDIMGVAKPMRFETWFEHIHPDDVERIVEANIEAFKTLRFDETMRVYHPQKQKWVWIHAISTGFEDQERQRKYVNGILIDVTREKETEKALRESERKRQSWIENSPVCTKIVDLDFNLQFMSASGIRDLKIDNINEFYGKPYPFHF